MDARTLKHPHAHTHARAHTSAHTQVEKQSVAATPKARKDVPIEPPKTNAETELRVRA